MNSLEGTRLALRARSALSCSLVTQRLLSYYDRAVSPMHKHGSLTLAFSASAAVHKNLFIINHPVCALLEYKVF